MPQTRLGIVCEVSDTGIAWVWERGVHEEDGAGMGSRGCSVGYGLGGSVHVGCMGPGYCQDLESS